jgi:hypothetical protein
MAGLVASGGLSHTGYQPTRLNFSLALLTDFSIVDRDPADRDVLDEHHRRPDPLRGRHTTFVSHKRGHSIIPAVMGLRQRLNVGLKRKSTYSLVDDEFISHAPEPELESGKRDDTQGLYPTTTEEKEDDDLSNSSCIIIGIDFGTT